MTVGDKPRRYQLRLSHGTRNTSSAFFSSQIARRFRRVLLRNADLLFTPFFRLFGRAVNGRRGQAPTLPICRPAHLPTCRDSDLPICRPSDLPTCPSADLPRFRLAHLLICRNHKWKQPCPPDVIRTFPAKFVRTFFWLQRGASGRFRQGLTKFGQFPRN